MPQQYFLNRFLGKAARGRVQPPTARVDTTSENTMGGDKSARCKDYGPLLPFNLDCCFVIMASLYNFQKVKGGFEKYYIFNCDGSNR